MDRLGTFIMALEQYCLLNQPADLLGAIQYAKGYLEDKELEELEITRNAYNESYGG